MYLQMDGVDDYLQTPSMTMDRMVIECLLDNSFSDASTHYLYDARSNEPENFVYNGTYNYGHGRDCNVFIDGVDRTNYYFKDYVPYNTPTTIEINSDTFYDGTLEFASAINIFAHNSGTSGFAKGNLYRVTYYLNNVLIADYDMSTGTVQDQSGNGNHATLSGGTWVSDTPTGTPVIYNYESEQQIYANRTNAYDLQQQVYKEIAQTFDTKLSLYQDILEAYTTEQVIYRTVNVLYDTMQEIYSDSVQRTYNYGLHISIYADRTQVYDIRQESYKNTSNQYNLEQAIYKATQSNQDVNIILYADRTEIADTTQFIYTEREYIYSTAQSLYDPDKSLISTIKLDGERTLRIYLQGEIKKEYLKAERELYVKLKGVMQ